MEAVSSAWSKPGAWAVESEEQDNEKGGYASSTDSGNSADFPSLSAAATTKIPKRNKPKKQTTLSLAEFTNTKFQDDSSLVLPTGPRERTAEELDRSRLGGGGFRYNSYNSSEGGRGPRDDSRRERREPRVLDSGPSRADEVDDWGATKKSVGASYDRRDRGGGSFGSSSSQSKADESDNWVSGKKSIAPMPSEGRRERRSYDLFNKEGSNWSGVDSDTWGKKRDESGGRGGDSDGWGKKREENGGSGVDSDSWGKKREDNGGSGRPRLVLQPRSLPVVNGNNAQEEKKDREVVKSNGKGGNPFGEAKPREEVLKEKGVDCKEIDEKFETVKVHKEGESLLGRKADGVKEDPTERAWRKPQTPPRAESSEDQLPEN